MIGEVARIAAATSLDDARSDPCLVGEEPLGFDELLVPFVRAGRERLASTGSERIDAVDHGLERWLMRRLARVWRDPFWARFDDARTVRQTTVQGLFEGYGSEVTTTGYDEYVAKALTTSLVIFFDRYPVAARLSGLVVLQWVRASDEFLERLLSDRAELSERFCGGTDIGTPISIAAGLAESHDGGRAPVAVTFSSGTKLVYKPKDLGLETRVSELISMANGWGLEPPLEPSNVLERDGYGWVGYVGHSECRDIEEIRNYYRRAGMLVAMTYALDSTDMHMENLIASGEHPMLIDTELILFADMGSGAEQRSVSTTGMVPSPHFERKGQDISALGGIGMPAPAASPFEHPNTDRMKPRAATVDTHERTNMPMLGSEVVEPDGFVEEVVEGFVALYRLISQNREAIGGADGWLARVDGSRVRFLFRSTNIYAQVIKGAFSLAGLADEAAFEKALERLEEAVPGDDWDALAVEEVASLRELSIPLFTVPADGLEVAAGERPTGCLLPRSPADLVRDRLEILGASDMERQIGLIRGCWAP